MGVEFTLLAKKTETEKLNLGRNIKEEPKCGPAGYYVKDGTHSGSQIRKKLYNKFVWSSKTSNSNNSLNFTESKK